ncbi:MAG: TdeIII family type II restriction endonuclease [Rickettsiales bacterium]|nr:MAG: TdeIII family type II restriction endonuclease [Rickettsiales bacterium]
MKSNTKNIFLTLLQELNIVINKKFLNQKQIIFSYFFNSLNIKIKYDLFLKMAKKLAQSNFEVVETQATAGVMISKEAQMVITDIVNNLISATTKPDKMQEIEKIRAVCQQGEMKKVKPTKVDLLLKNNNEFYLFDIKTAKPNMGGFKEFKQTLLEWVAVVLALNPQAKINTLIAIPYNPYEPAPYNRWTMAGMLDLPNELKVADEFWNFLCPDSYNDLLDCFEEVGVEMRGEIDNYFKKFDKK